jgi:high-affinity nickel-transport protein
MTGLSVFVALFVGLIEVAQIMARTLNFKGGFWNALDNLNFGIIGAIIVAAFIISWAGAFLIYRSQHIEERWSRALRQ